MNLLENYIEEIHKEEPYVPTWASEFPDRTFIRVEITTNCYGQKKREERFFTTEEWAKIKEQGYYMG